MLPPAWLHVCHKVARHWAGAPTNAHVNRRPLLSLSKSRGQTPQYIAASTRLPFAPDDRYLLRTVSSELATALDTRQSVSEVCYEPAQKTCDTSLLISSRFHNITASFTANTKAYSRNHDLWVVACVVLLISVVAVILNSLELNGAAFSFLPSVSMILLI